MARESINGMTYGGVQFGYSQSTLRLFYPSAPEACVACLSSSWGKAHSAISYNMFKICDRSADATLKIWGPPKSGLTAATS